jgi:DedD protein
VKERLTGAIILVALMVLLVPELLTGPLRSAPRAAALSPAGSEAPLRSYTIELADEARTRSAAQASGPRQPAPLSPTAQADNAAPEAPGRSGAGDAGGDASTTGVTSAAAATSAVTTPSSSGGASAGASTPTPSGPAGTSARVARANSARASGAAPTPGGRENGAGASGAWVVQLGSFATRANAEHLAQQVRSQGFEVSVSQSPSGRHLFRVRVGAAHDRAGALALAQKLRGLGHRGTVLPRQGGA